MEKNLVKIRIPLPEGDPSGVDSEWMWALPEGEDTFEVDNVPILTYGLSNGDVVRASVQDGILVFEELVRRGGHSTYRLYAKGKLDEPEMVRVLSALKAMKCDTEVATTKIAGIDVLPEADIYAVYKLMSNAEQAGLLEFDEGHCGHELHSR